MNRKLVYAVPPDDAESRDEFLRAPRLDEAALVLDGGELRPALVMRGDLAIVLTWPQCIALADALRDWSTLVVAGKRRDRPLPGVVRFAESATK